MTTIPLSSQAKPSSIQEFVPAAATKPDVSESKPFNLLDALKGSSGTADSAGLQQSSEVTLDFEEGVSRISAKLKDPPSDKYTDDIMAELTDPLKMSSDHDYAAEKTRLYLQMYPAVTSGRRDKIAKQLSAGGRQVDKYDNDVTAQLLTETKLEAMRYHEAENVKRVGAAKG